MHMTKNSAETPNKGIKLFLFLSDTNTMKTNKLPKNLFLLIWMFLAFPFLSGCLLKSDDPFKSSSKSSPAAESTAPSSSDETILSVSPRKMKNLGIFYGWPTAINNVHTIDWNNRVSLASDEMAKYDRLILGATLEDPAHGDHVNTKTIITNIKGGLTGTQMYGYVCIGSCGGANPSALTINAKVDQWEVMEVDGIFFDEAGFDFGSVAETDAQKRARMVAIVGHAHSLGLKVMINAWDPDDIFTKVSENPVPFISGDSFLLESYLYSANLPTNDSIVLTNSGSFSDFLARVDKAKNSKPNGVELWGVSTTGENIASFNVNHWSNVVSMAWAHNLTGIGWGT